MAEPDPVRTYDGARLRAVAQSFQKIGRQIAGQGLADVTAAVAEVTVDVLPHAAWASVTTLQGERFRTVAATDNRARAADNVQYELRSGPCVEAVVDDRVFLVDDMRTDNRWPEFNQRAAAEFGVGSMLSHRLQIDDQTEVISGLNVYATRPHAFSDADVEVGHLLAAHAAVAIAAAGSATRAANLQRALDSNRDIGVAIGILMALYKVTRDEAFDLMRVASQRTHRKLHAVAIDIVETGALPD